MLLYDGTNIVENQTLPLMSILTCWSSIHLFTFLILSYYFRIPRCCLTAFWGVGDSPMSFAVCTASSWRPWHNFRCSHANKWHCGTYTKLIIQARAKRSALQTLRGTSASEPRNVHHSLSASDAYQHATDHWPVRHGEFSQMWVAKSNVQGQVYEKYTIYNIW